MSEAELVHAFLGQPNFKNTTINWARISVQSEPRKSGSPNPVHGIANSNLKNTRLQPPPTESPSQGDTQTPPPKETLASSQQESIDRWAVPTDHHWAGKSWSNTKFNPTLLSSSNPLDRPQLQIEQINLLRRAKPNLPTLNLRHLDRAEALVRLELFVRQCKIQKRWIFRIITGKGIFSRNEAVLKPAILGWCADRCPQIVCSWAPEIDADGEYGRLLIQLSRRRKEPRSIK